MTAIEFHKTQVSLTEALTQTPTQTQPESDIKRTSNDRVAVLLMGYGEVESYDDFANYNEQALNLLTAKFAPVPTWVYPPLAKLLALFDRHEWGHTHANFISPHNAIFEKQRAGIETYLQEKWGDRVQVFKAFNFCKPFLPVQVIAEIYAQGFERLLIYPLLVVDSIFTSGIALEQVNHAIEAVEQQAAIEAAKVVQKQATQMRATHDYSLHDELDTHIHNDAHDHDHHHHDHKKHGHQAEHQHGAATHTHAHSTDHPTDHHEQKLSHAHTHSPESRSRNWQPQIRYIPSFFDRPDYIALLAELTEAAIHTEIKASLLPSQIGIVLMNHGCPMKAKGFTSGIDESQALYELVRSRLIHRYPLISVGWLNHDTPMIDWTQPDAQTAAQNLIQLGAKAIVMMPIGFATENHETLLDVHHIIHHLEHQHADVQYVQLPCINDHPQFLQMVAGWADEHVAALLTHV